MTNDLNRKFNLIARNHDHETEASCIKCMATVYVAGLPSGFVLCDKCEKEED